MAKAKLRAIYHEFFCEGNLGEMDAFFEIKNGKLGFIDGWSLNDAHWRGEYMRGLLRHLGAEVKQLPDEYHDVAAQLVAKAFGIDFEPDEDSVDDLAEDAELFFSDGTSDKVYNLELYNGGGNDGWHVVGHYGRRGGKIKDDAKCQGVPYKEAKAVYDKVLNGKLKKGYQKADDGSGDDDEEE